ncbi:MAG TPA: hypothetical protein VFZ24_12040 [Longimicrobiales bacterium]
MVELKHDALVFSFPEVHRDAVLRVEFLRTLRVPDDRRSYVIPSLGRLPVRYVQDFPAHVSPAWVAREGVLVPLHAADALRLSFTSAWAYPCAVQVAIGRKDALTGRPWRDRLQRDPQNYLVAPDQCRVDGWSDGVGIHQFTGWAGHEPQAGDTIEHLALQLAVHPMRRAAYDRRTHAGALSRSPASPVCYGDEPDVGAAPLEQEILHDPYDFGDWDQRRGRCLIYLVSARSWRPVTGSEPPPGALTPEDYARAGIPWSATYAAGASPTPR